MPPVRKRKAEAELLVETQGEGEGISVQDGTATAESQVEGLRRSSRLTAKSIDSSSKTTKVTKKTGTKKKVSAIEKVKDLKEKVVGNKKKKMGNDADFQVLEVGDKIPALTLKTDAGSEISTTTLAGDKKGFVIFTYPKANTGGCTNQACGFRDKHDSFLEAGYAVYGLSKDSPSAQSSWKKAQNLPYTLLCDPESQLIKVIGAFKVENGGTLRCHFVFDKEGVVIEKKLGVKPVESPVDALESVTKL